MTGVGPSPAASSGSSVLDEVAGAIGADAAMKLSAKFGGRRLYIPKQIPANDAIAVVIGAAAAADLARYFHGTSITFPARPGKRDLVLTLAAKGTLTNSRIAEEVGVSERMVYRILAEEADRRQPDLFKPRD